MKVSADRVKSLKGLKGLRGLNCLRRWSAVAVVCLSVSACVSTPKPDAAPAVPPGLFEDQAFQPPAAAPNAAEVFALSPAMRQFLEHEIEPLLRRHGTQRGFVQALQDMKQLRIEYDSLLTRTAAEAFDARAGNCLSLVVMTGALAKQLNLPVAYQALLGSPSWSRLGGLTIVNGHVNMVVAQRLIDRVATLDTSPQIVIEFGRLPLGRGQALQVVSEATIVSMFMNNRAAEHLVQGAIDNAYAHAKAAVQQDPRFAAAYNTLGVIYDRKGLSAAAERAWRTALARDSDDLSALTNLRLLLQAQNRFAEAAPLAARLAQLEKEPPFAHFDRGVAAARAGDYATARNELLREMQRDPDYHEFHFWLAVSLYGLGDVQTARKHLTTAMNNSLTRQEQALYGAKLKGLSEAERPASAH
jgi:tetratricopeptide (TPR) repeat protein